MKIYDPRTGASSDKDMILIKRKSNEMVLLCEGHYGVFFFFKTNGRSLSLSADSLSPGLKRSNNGRGKQELIRVKSHSLHLSV